MGHPIRLNSTLKVPRIKNLQISLLTLFAACRISLYDTKVWPYCDRYPPGLLQVDLYIRSITPSHLHTVLHYFPSTCLPSSRSYQSLHGFLVCLTHFANTCNPYHRSSALYIHKHWKSQTVHCWFHSPRLNLLKIFNVKHIINIPQN